MTLQPGSEEPTDGIPAVPLSMRTEMRPISEVNRYWRNPRRKQNIEKLAASLRRYGWRQPIVIDGDGTIIVGDTRYLAAQANNESHVPVWVAADLTDAETHAYRIADNRLADEAEWDDALIADELRLLQQLGVDELEAATGFDEKELASYLEVAADSDHVLEKIEITQFPKMTWVLIGVPTNQFIEIADEIEKIKRVPDIFCEVTANDDDRR